ncbi:MAG: hypothetical protein JWL98_855 [Xanthomonadaceae bacterium]|nr:hypothetical protein [Xanthomonadaceae bacterium]
MQHVAILIATTLAMSSGSANDRCAVQSAAHTVPLVELYTSEGCSSCPPADRWLSRRFASGDANYLAFHVDYWDDIGWPDRFASHRYTLRQRARVAATGSTIVYTPQVMVGSSVQAKWSAGDNAWGQTLQKAARPVRVGLALRMQPDSAGWQATIGATPIGTLGDGAQLWLARHVDAQTSVVNAGENSGVTLHHDRVVLQLLGPWSVSGGTVVRRVRLPAHAGPWGVTAFVQARNGDVLQSLNLDAASCQGFKR